jgi:PAS domain S-box-containing protein
MISRNNRLEGAAELRKRAAEIAREKTALSPENLDTLSIEEIQRMVHELRVHQIQLEMQNEELQLEQLELESSRARYFDLYDLAPVGYCTISEKGLTLESNFATATLLGMNPDALTMQPFSMFISKEDQDIYYFHCKQLVETGLLQEFDLRMIKNGGMLLWVHLTITLQNTDGAFVRHVVMNDITQHKNAEEQLANEKYLQQLLLDHFPGVVLLLRTSTREVVASNQAGRNIGVVCGSMCYETWVQRKSPCTWCLAPKLWATGKEQRAEIEAGGRLWEAHWIPVTNDLYMHYSFDITDRKRDEEKLHVQDNVIRQALSISNSFTFDWDVASDQVLRSTSCQKIFGDDDLINATAAHFSQRVHPDDRQQLDKLLRNMTPTENTYTTDFRLVLNNKSIVTLQETAQAFFDCTGKVTRVIGVATDITERKKAEDALTHSHDLMRYIIEHNRSAVAVHDRDLRYIYVSKRYLDDYKVNIRDVIGKHHYDVFPDLPQKWRDVHQKALSGEISRAEDDPYVREDGTVDWTRWECRPWYEANGSIGGIIIYTEVITERKKVEDALRKSVAQLRAITDSAQDAILMMDQNGCISFWNPAAESIFGYTGDEAIGKNLHQLIVPQHYHEAHHAAFARFQQAGQGDLINKTLELKACHKNGNEISVELSLSSLHLQDCWHSVGIIRDITDRKRAEEDKVKLKAQLLQAQKMEAIGSLAGGIAHDLNNILFPISGLSEILLEDIPPDTPEYQSIQQIHKSATRGSALVKQILAFSRQSNPQKLPIRIQPILKEALKLAQATIPRSIEVKSHIDTDCGMILADPPQIHQIAMNLITNAFHAVEQTGGMIDIALKETTIESAGGKDELLFHAIPGYILAGRYACITVSDTGTGIDPRNIDKIFDPYFTTKELGKGTGLGLSVVHGIVKEHGGDIRVYSEVGRGTAFHVYLPLLEDAKDSKPAAIARKHPTGHERILLVEDEEPILSMEKMMLERLGYQITTRLSSPDALAAFKANPDNFDLVISDKGMPNITGEQLARELLSIRPRIPIIICSGFSDENDEQQAISLGVKGFLKKPVATGDLAEMVRKVLDDADDSTR